MSGPALVVLTAVAIGCVAITFLVFNATASRASRSGSYGTLMGSWLGVETRPGDPAGITGGLPAVEGVQRTPVHTGDYGLIGHVAVVEERTASGTTTVAHLWIHAGVDADIVRHPDATTERTHATRGGLAAATAPSVRSASRCALTS